MGNKTKAMLQKVKTYFASCVRIMMHIFWKCLIFECSKIQQDLRKSRMLLAVGILPVLWYFDYSTCDGANFLYEYQMSVMPSTLNANTLREYKPFNVALNKSQTQCFRSTQFCQILMYEQVIKCRPLHSCRSLTLYCK